MLWSHICENFSYSFARACITFQKINLRTSDLDPFVAEAKRYLRVPSARLECLAVVVFKAESWKAFISGSNDCQTPTLAARVDRLEEVLSQNDRPVAEKMRTGLLYLELLVLGKNMLTFCNYLKRVTFYHFNFYHDLAH